MAHAQVKEEYRAMIKLIRRQMYPMFNARRTDRHGHSTPDFDKIARAGGLLVAHDILIRRYRQIISNEERQMTDEEFAVIGVVTEKDIIRVVEAELREEEIAQQQRNAEELARYQRSIAA